MSLEKFLISDQNDTFFVTLEVDRTKLTVELATEINNFWGGNDDRADSMDGDVVKAVIKLYGSRVIRSMLCFGGAVFDVQSEPQMAKVATFWTGQMQEEEGWPGADGTPHGALGIRVVAADASMPGFDECDLDEVTA